MFFITAGNVGVLLVARLLQGIATGAAMTTLGAALVDLNPPHAPGRAGLINGIAPVAGLAVGALGCGALVQFAPSPTHLVYAVLLLGMVLAAVVVARMPETSALRPGGAASLKPRLGIPARLRDRRVRPGADHRGQLGARRPLPLPRPVRRGRGVRPEQPPDRRPGRDPALRHRRDHLVPAAQPADRGGCSGWPRRCSPSAPRSASWPSWWTTSRSPPSARSCPASASGPSALASFGTLAVLAAPHERGELFAVALVIAYVAFSVPAVIAGLAAGHVGLHLTALVYGLVVAALGLVALVAQRMRRTTS